MRMYGPASTFFPLKTVHDTLRGQLQQQEKENKSEDLSTTTNATDEDALREQQEEVLAWCKDIVANLVAKGLTLAGVMLEV